MKGIYWRIENDSNWKERPLIKVRAQFYCCIVWYPSHVASNYDPFIDVHVCTYMGRLPDRRSIIRGSWLKPNKPGNSIEATGGYQSNIAEGVLLFFIICRITHTSHICLYIQYHCQFYISKSHMHGAGGSLEFDFDFSYLKTVHFKLSSYALYQ